MSLLGILLKPKSFYQPPTILAACTSTRSRRGTGASREYHNHRQRRSDSIGGGRRTVQSKTRGTSVEDVFVRSLVLAGTCRECSTPASTSPQRTGGITSLPSTRNPCHRAPIAHHRAFSSGRPSPQTGTALQVEEGAHVSRQEYENLVDTYDNRTLRKLEKKGSKAHYRLAPRLVITPERETLPPPGQRIILPPVDEEHSNRITTLGQLLHSPLGSRTEAIWRKYSQLPTPRLPYLPDIAIMRLFRHLAWVEVRELKSSQRFFSLLEEAVHERIPIGPDVWNTAISFAGRWVRRISAEEVKAAIDTWLRMEREGDTPATNVTFNILFDIAVKAGRYALADTIYAEMDRRKLELNRYFRTSMIYYAGRRGDAESVRAAFREFVAASEIVDTAVMNCVILSLVRCGETASAENVMGKMKLLHEQKFGTAALRDWGERKRMGRRLDKRARRLRKERAAHMASFFGSPYSDNDKKEAIQRAAPIAPDALTYRILIKWHATVSGNLDRIRTYMDEMTEAGHKTHHNTFFSLFNGFRIHGGYAFTAWNRKSLEAFWQSYIRRITELSASQASVVEEKTTSADSAASGPCAVHPVDMPDAFGSPESDQGPEPSEKEEGNEGDEDPDPLPSHLMPIEFRVGTVIAALAAFYKCAGAKRMLAVWDEVREKWSGMSEGDRRRIEDVLNEKVREAGMYIDQ